MNFDLLQDVAEPQVKKAAFKSDPESRLEPEYADAFSAWRARPDQTTTATLLRTIRPAIEKAVVAHLGTTDPVSMSRARQMALQALPRYDARSSKLQTFLINQLQALRRYGRQRQQGVRVPERTFYLQQTLQDKARELEARMGRTPSMHELAQFAKVPLKRVISVMSLGLPTAEGVFTGEDGTPYLPETEQDSQRIWLDYVYADLNPIDQKIMEWSLGMYGQPRLSNQEIARRLNRTPGAISQRKAAIQQLINEAYEKMS